MDAVGQLQQVRHGIVGDLRVVSEAAKSSAAIPRHGRFIGPSFRMQREFLHSPCDDFAHQEFVLVPAIDLVDGGELAGFLPAWPNLPRMVPSSSIL